MKIKLTEQCKPLITFAAALVLAACSSTSSVDGPGIVESTATGEEQAVALDDGSADVTATGTEDGLGVNTLDESQEMPENAVDPLTLQTVFYFDFDSSVLNMELREALDAQAEYLQTTSSLLRLEGHSDDRGTREYNLALGERRAKAVIDYLALQGVERSRMEAISYGEEKPVAFGAGEDSWKLNRRVEIK